MAIDVEREHLVPIVEAARHYPGRTPHFATCVRHALRGVRGVRLDTVMIGGRRYTSVEAIRRFLNEINARSPLGSQSKVQFGAHEDQINAELARHGL
jgi:hypothetical protein